jgi:hypothetical protein
MIVFRSLLTAGAAEDQERISNADDVFAFSAQHDRVSRDSDASFGTKHCLRALALSIEYNRHPSW